MKKTILTISLAAALASTTVGATDGSNHVLPAGAVLTIDATSDFDMGGPPTAIIGGKGLFVGTGMGNFGEGSRGGAPTSHENGAVTAPWLFFCNLGYNYISTSTSFTGDTATGVDMSGWIVTWNNIETIPMGGCQFGDPANNGGFSPCDANKDGVDDLDPLLNTGRGVFSWDGNDNGAYTIFHRAHVPAGDPSSFGGVLYTVNLRGTVLLSGNPAIGANVAPTANDDLGLFVGTGNVDNLGLTDNDSDPALDDAPDKSSIDLDPVIPGQQTTLVTVTLGNLVSVTTDAVTGADIVTYDGTNAGSDSFSYTVNDFRGANTSNVATVSVTVGNLAPVCVDDGIPEGGIFIIGVDEPAITIDVSTNDTDGNNAIDLSTYIQTGPGGIGDTAQGAGTLMNNGDGTFTYTPPAGFIGTDTFTYEATDDETVPGLGDQLTCAGGTVSILVADIGPPISGVEMGYLVLDTGIVGLDQNKQPVLGEGSWFSMETSPNVFTYTPVAGFDHLQFGVAQPGLSPNVPGIDNPWVFFGNLGVHQTTVPVTRLSNKDGVAKLDFQGWDVSWNAIPTIPLKDRALDPADDGIATLECYNTQADFDAGTPSVGPVVTTHTPTCDDGDLFLLTYTATVPAGDPSGFGNVNYAVHFEGVISDTKPVAGCDPDDLTTDLYSVSTAAVIADCVSMTPLTLGPGATATSAGNGSGLYLTAAETGPVDPLVNPDSGEQCIGGCLDFVVPNVTVGGEINLVVKLLADIPTGAIYRKLINGKWQNFDTSGVDIIGSGSVDPATGNCGSPETTSFAIGLRQGNRCLFMKITDGGPNDADGAMDGVITDPSGVLLSGAPNTPEGDSDGCSISKTPVALTERADWLIVAGFIALMGLVSFKRRRHNG